MFTHTFFTNIFHKWNIGYFQKYFCLLVEVAPLCALYYILYYILAFLNDDINNVLNQSFEPIHLTESVI